MTRTKLFRERTLAEEEVLAKKIQKGWVESVDRLRPKTTGKKKPATRAGYVSTQTHHPPVACESSRLSDRCDSSYRQPVHPPLQLMSEPACFGTLQGASSSGTPSNGGTTWS